METFYDADRHGSHAYGIRARRPKAYRNFDAAMRAIITEVVEAKP
jgi:hypothetical protein